MNIRKKNITKVPLFLRVVPFYVSVAGLLWASHLLSPNIETLSKDKPTFVAESITVHPSQRVISGQPARVTVSRLGIDLVIKKGGYTSSTKEWTLSDDAAYFATMTTPPNDSHGNTFIYGHNTAKIFAPLQDIAIGDRLTIDTSNGYTFEYIYRADAIVTPDITTVLYEDPATPELTIMTCEGIWSKVRRIMYFDFKQVT